MTVQPKNTRVYLGKIARYPREKQKAKCIEICDELELPKIDKRSYYEHNEVISFIHDLRKDEIAIVARLDGLAEIKGVGVGLRFLMNVYKIDKTSLFILDAQTGLKSTDGDKWYQLVEATAMKIMRGRPLGSEQAKVMAAIKHEEREPDLVEAWKGKKGDSDYMAVANIWGNLAMKPAEAAIKKFPDEELSKASKSTIQRIFGTRQECLDWLNK